MPRPLSPTRRSCRPQPNDTLETLAARELPELPVDEAVALLKEWNPHLGFGRRNFQYLLVSDLVFVEPGGGGIGGFA